MSMTLKLRLLLYGNVDQNVNNNDFGHNDFVVIADDHHDGGNSDDNNNNDDKLEIHNKHNNDNKHDDDYDDDVNDDNTDDDDDDDDYKADNTDDVDNNDVDDSLLSIISHRNIFVQLFVLKPNLQAVDISRGNSSTMSSFTNVT